MKHTEFNADNRPKVGDIVYYNFEGVSIALVRVTSDGGTLGCSIEPVDEFSDFPVDVDIAEYHELSTTPYPVLGDEDTRFSLIDSNCGVAIDGFFGKWSAVDVRRVRGEYYLLMENDEDGDEVPYIIVDSHRNVVCQYVYNGFDDLYEELEIED